MKLYSIIRPGTVSLTRCLSTRLRKTREWRSRQFDTIITYSTNLVVLIFLKYSNPVPQNKRSEEGKTELKSQICHFHRYEVINSFTVQLVTNNFVYMFLLLEIPVFSHRPFRRRPIHSLLYSHLLYGKPSSLKENYVTKYNKTFCVPYVILCSLTY